MKLSHLFVNKNAAESAAAPVARFTLLFVDDEPGVLSALKRVFRQESYRILTAANGAEALGVLEREAVELIVSDHRMPGMTGAELLTAVRAKWPDTIRIMLTGYADVQSIMGAVNEGAVFKFMTKPWQDDDLRITVARALEQYQLRREVRALRAENQQQEQRLGALSGLFEQERGMLAKVLLREKKLTAAQYDELLRKQRASGGSMYREILQCGFIPAEAIANVLQKALNLEVVDLREIRVAPQAASMFSPEFCRDNLLLPLKLADGQLTAAMADPSDIFKRDNIESLLGLRLNVVLATGPALDQKIGEVFGAQAPTEAPEEQNDAIDDIDLIIEDEQENEDVTEMLRSSKIPPVVRIVNAIVTEALRRGASDIHIEPKLKETVVRYRIDGLLQERMRLPPHIHSAVISRIKVLAKLDIAEKRRPQDGRIALRALERMVDLRVSSLPTLYGEKVVLRLLDRGASVRRIEDLGLSDENLERVHISARKPQGIIVCTGPTGSGKTTLLYSLLHQHLQSTHSYGTIEDPVEYSVEEASQVLVRDKAGLTFPSALRSMLRQDPDVILIGEMRDHETSQIAFQAALTGHMVFSTLHTNNAVASITRLLDLGVERYLIASALECAIAQRLLRVVCPECRAPVKPAPEMLRLLDITEEQVGEQQHGAGCAKCNGTGYTGRLGAFEVLSMSDELRERILAGARETELIALARDNGMQTLFDDALRKVRRGQTTLEEILRVLGPRATVQKHCAGCGRALVPSFNICPTCGRAIRRTCPKCSTRLAEDWKLCPVCGRVCDMAPNAP